MDRRFTHGLLLVIAGLLATNLLRGPGVARAETLEAQTPDLVALVAAGNGSGQNVLFLVDPKAKRLLVYDDVARGKLSLRCVRDLQYELQLQSFPGAGKKGDAKQEPSVRAMRDYVKRLSKKARTRKKH